MRSTHGDLDVVVREDQGRVGGSEVGRGHCEGCVCRVSSSSQDDFWRDGIARAQAGGPARFCGRRAMLSAAASKMTDRLGAFVRPRATRVTEAQRGASASPCERRPAPHVAVVPPRRSAASESSDARLTRRLKVPRQRKLSQPERADSDSL